MLDAPRLHSTVDTAHYINYTLSQNLRLFIPLRLLHLVQTFKLPFSHSQQLWFNNRSIFFSAVWRHLRKDFWVVAVAIWLLLLLVLLVLFCMVDGWVGGWLRWSVVKWGWAMVADNSKQVVIYWFQVMRVARLVFRFSILFNCAKPTQNTNQAPPAQAGRQRQTLRWRQATAARCSSILFFVYFYAFCAPPVGCPGCRQSRLQVSRWLIDRSSSVFSLSPSPLPSSFCPPFIHPSILLFTSVPGCAVLRAWACQGDHSPVSNNNFISSLWARRWLGEQQQSTSTTTTPMRRRRTQSWNAWIICWIHHLSALFVLLTWHQNALTFHSHLVLCPVPYIKTCAVCNASVHTRDCVSSTHSSSSSSSISPAPL